MAEFKEVMKQFNRMCDAQEICQKCPVNETRGLLTCWRALADKPDKMEEIVMQWAEEHPVKKNYQKFEETFGINPILIDWWNTRGADWLNEEYKEPKND